METLPTELRREILSHLTLQSLRDLRLTSRSWALLGEEYLIAPLFNIRQHRDDCNRLLALSRHERLSGHVQALYFDMGEVDEYHARHNSYFIQYMRDPEDRDESSGVAWAEYRMIKDLKERFAVDYCRSDILEEALKNLANLEVISVTLSKCPFEDELWQRIWNIPTSRLLPRVATTQRFTSIMTAAVPCQIKQLCHDRLPFEFWGQKLALMNQISEAFRCIETVKIVSDYSAFPNDRRREECLQGLGKCLQSATKLKSLHLAFWVQSRPPLSFSTCFGDEYVWPELHTFCLEGVQVNITDFMAFLLRHKQSLKRLQLGGTGRKSSRFTMSEGLQIESGTFEELCKDLHGLELEKFNTRPFFGPPPFGRSTVENEPLYDDDWNRIEASEGLGAAKLEAFVLGQGEWPQMHEPPQPMTDELFGGFPDDFI